MPEKKEKQTTEVPMMTMEQLKSLSFDERFFLANQEMSFIKKDATGQYNDAKFVTKESLLNYVRPILFKWGMSVHMSDYSITEVMPGVLKDTSVDKKDVAIITGSMEITVKDAFSAETISTTFDFAHEGGFSNVMLKQGSNITYVSRYAIGNFFMIPMGEEDPETKKVKEAEQQASLKLLSENRNKLIEAYNNKNEGLLASLPKFVGNAADSSKVLSTIRTANKTIIDRMLEAVK